MSGTSGVAAVPRPSRRRQSARLWDGREWPCAGSYAGRPVFRYRTAPAGLHTTRQLAAKGLQPGEQDPAGYLAWGPSNRPRWAFLWRPELAAAKRPMTPGRWAAIRAANAALQVCPTCQVDVGYRIPGHLGECLSCADTATERAIARHQHEHDGAGTVPVAA